MTMRLFSFKLNMAFLPAKYGSAKNLNKTVDFGWLRLFWFCGSNCSKKNRRESRETANPKIPRKICEICEICERYKHAAKSASFSKLAKKLGENPRAKSTRWKRPPTKLVHRRLSYKLAATYSPTLSCSTIGAHGLNCSVRNGKRCAPWL